MYCFFQFGALAKPVAYIFFCMCGCFTVVMVAAEKWWRTAPMPTTNGSCRCTLHASFCLHLKNTLFSCCASAVWCKGQWSWLYECFKVVMATGADKRRQATLVATTNGSYRSVLRSAFRYAFRRAQIALLTSGFMQWPMFTAV